MDVTVNTDLKRVFVWTGQVTHLLDPTAPPAPDTDALRQPALCNIRPIWPGTWFDSGSELPLCRNCAAKEAALRDRT